MRYNLSDLRFLWEQLLQVQLFNDEAEQRKDLLMYCIMVVGMRNVCVCDKKKSEFIRGEAEAMGCPLMEKKGIRCRLSKIVRGY